MILARFCSFWGVNVAFKCFWDLIHPFTTPRAHWGHLKLIPGRNMLLCVPILLFLCGCAQNEGFWMILARFCSFWDVIVAFKCFWDLIYPFTTPRRHRGHQKANWPRAAALFLQFWLPSGLGGPPVRFSAREKLKKIRGVAFFAPGCSAVCWRTHRAKKNGPRGPRRVSCARKTPFFGTIFRARRAPRNGSPGTRGRFLVSGIGFRVSHNVARLGSMLFRLI